MTEKKQIILNKKPEVLQLLPAKIQDTKSFRHRTTYLFITQTLITRTINQNDSLLNAPRTSREIVIDSIYADIDWANDNLESVAQQTAVTYGRVTNQQHLPLKLGWPYLKVPARNFMDMEIPPNICKLPEM